MKPASVLDDYYMEHEMGILLKKEHSTLAKDRCRKMGPPFRKLGRMTVYPKKEFALWVSAQPLIWGKSGKVQAGR